MAILSLPGLDLTQAIKGSQTDTLAGAATKDTSGASQNNPTVTVTDPVLASALAKLAGTATKGTSTPTSPTTTGDNEAVTFQFVAGWILLIVLLTAAAQTRIGYVIIYYSLILMILLILVTEYQQIVPLLNFETIGQLNAKNAS
jgi:hypothetical protein